MTPLIAIVGRPNVGKSTLFNRLVGRGLAIVHDEPGVTRDRHYAETHLAGRDALLVDTGGFDPEADDALGQGIVRQVDAAIEEADVIVCVLDGRAHPTPTDRLMVERLRRADKPIVYVANKVDTGPHELETADLHILGVGELVPVSALHGRAFERLEAAIGALLPPAGRARPSDSRPPPSARPEGVSRAEQPPRVALVGRPNVGKSSLFNRLCGEDRVLVDAEPGTTIDTIDVQIERDGRQITLLDTAGVRRRSRVAAGIEAASVMRALRAMGTADVVVLLCDITRPVAEQDLRLLGHAIERGRAIVLALNKVDLLDAPLVRKAEQAAREAMRFAPWSELVLVSAHTGLGIPSLFSAVHRAFDSFHRRVPTGELNRFFRDVLEHNPPPTHGGRAPRLYYITQAESAPPVFIVKSSAPQHVRESYRRFVTNRIRNMFGFVGVPLAVHFKERGKKTAE